VLYQLSYARKSFGRLNQQNLTEKRYNCQRMKTIFIFGNSELKMDSLPLQILPELQKVFPNINFEVKDPNEEWEVPEELTVIDTVVGPEKVTIFDDLETFAGAPQMTMHDFDALANLKYLKKLGKLKKIKIIGVPPEMSEKEAIKSVTEALRLISTI
jgi:hypothetical protein